MQVQHPSSCRTKIFSSTTTDDGIIPLGPGGAVTILSRQYYSDSGYSLDGYRAGSGFKIHVENLSYMTLNLGPHTTSPLASIGVSLNYGDFTTVNVSEGSNTIPLQSLQIDSEENTTGTSVIRINTEGWQDNRINLENITLNSVRLFTVRFKLWNRIVCSYTDITVGCKGFALQTVKTCFSVHRRFAFSCEHGDDSAVNQRISLIDRLLMVCRGNTFLRV